MNLRVGKWWNELLASAEMDRLWKTWVTQIEGNWEQGVNKLVTPLRALPFDLYVYIGDKKTFFSRLHYSGVPRKKYWQIVSLMLLHERTLMEMNPKGGNETLYPLDGETRPQKEGGGDETSHPWENGSLSQVEEEKRNETFPVTIPEELKTPEAKKVLARLQKKGMLDADLQPSTLVGWQKGVLAYELTERLKIVKRWVVMATLWKCSDKTLRQNYSKNFNDLLPEVFTREEAQLMRLHQGIRQGNVRLMLSNWKKRGYIEEYGTVMPQSEVMRQRYIKTASYLEKHPQVA